MSPSPLIKRKACDKVVSSDLSHSQAMIRAGFPKTVRKRSSSDGRAWEVAITQKGLDALSDIKVPFGEINAVLDKNIDAKDAERLAASLKKILAALEE